MDYLDLNELTGNCLEAAARHAWQKKRRVTNVPGIRALLRAQTDPEHPESAQLLPAVRAHTDQKDI